MRALIETLAAGKLHPHIHGHLPLAEANRAHEMLESGAVLGRLLLRPLESSWLGATTKGTVEDEHAARREQPNVIGDGRSRNRIALAADRVAPCQLTERPKKSASESSKSPATEASILSSPDRTQPHNSGLNRAASGTVELLPQCLASAVDHPCVILGLQTLLATGNIVLIDGRRPPR